MKDAIFYDATESLIYFPSSCLIEMRCAERVRRAHDDTDAAEAAAAMIFASAACAAAMRCARRDEAADAARRFQCVK